MRFLLSRPLTRVPNGPLRGSQSLPRGGALAGTRGEGCRPCALALLIASLRRGRRSGQRAQSAAIEVLHPVFVYPPRVFRNSHGRFLRASVRNELWKLFARYRPDAVIGYWAHPDGEVAVSAARQVGAAALVIVGGSDVLILARDERRRRTITNVLRAADAVLTVGAALREKVVELGIPAERVHVLDRGVDPNLFNPGDTITARKRLGVPADQRVVLWVGWSRSKAWMY